jgi:hypothetical protein
MLSIFALGVGGAVMLRAWGGAVFSDFEMFKRTLVALEVVFSVWNGRLVYSIYDAVDHAAKDEKVFE